MAMDMQGFEPLELGVSQKFRQAWWRPGDDGRGTLRVEFNNRHGHDKEGAVYDYSVPESVVNDLRRVAEGVSAASVGSLLHKEVIAQKERCPYVLVRKAQE